MHYLFLLLRHLYFRVVNYFKQKNFYKKAPIKTDHTQETYIPSSTQKKPKWVVNEIIRIKAMNPRTSHRIIAAVFNARFDEQSVGKTFVGYTLRNYKYEVEVLRKELKKRPAHTVKFNQTWGMDLTFIDKKPVLGIIEHHSRKVLGLIPLRQKSSVNILLALFSVLKKYPAPKQVRTDNESCFTSRLVRFSLWFLGIKYQRIDKNSPWQNGRIERFFGTFKANLSLLKYEEKDLYYLSQSFSFWYNNIRPHQNLNYDTPENVYQQRIDGILQRSEE